jgi:hypothetical protein
MRTLLVALLLVAASACTLHGGRELGRHCRCAEPLEREAEQLRADLREAEETLIAIESALTGTHTRAEAVSDLADSGILVERAAKLAPWREGSVRDAREKLEEADRHVQAGHFGSAMFFTAQARRIAMGLIREAEAPERP